MPSHRHPIIRDFLDYIQNVCRYSMHTLRSYTYDLDDYAAFCNHFDSSQEFIELNQTAIQAYLQHLSRKGLNAKTLARRLASIKSLYKYMLKNNRFRKETLLNFENPGFSRFFFEGRFFYKSPSMATGRGNRSANHELDCVRPYHE